MGGGQQIHQYLCAHVTQDESYGVNQDEGHDRNIYRKVFPVADNNRQSHGEGREEHAVRDSGQRAYHIDGRVQQRETVDNPVYWSNFH